MRFSTVLLLSLVAMVGCQDMTTIKSPVQGFLETLKKALPVLIDVLNSVFDEVQVTAFRAALRAAVSLVDTMFPAQPLPRVPERWWGDRDTKCRDDSIRPFTLHFSDEMIADLRERIHKRRCLTPAPHGTGNTFGSNAVLVAHFLDNWADVYDFKSREDWLYSFPQFITNIQGLDIHYIHMKPQNPHNKKVLPLLLIHGFPLTAFEYVHVLQNLMEERDEHDFVFEAVVPDIPGFAYSEATYKTGMAPYQIGIIMKNLMLRLGKSQFYIHCGDIGHFIGPSIAVLFPEIVLGLHTNFPSSRRPQTLVKMILGQLYPPAVVEARYENRLYPLSARLKFIMEFFGYFAIQASKPDNIGHGLDDSPVTAASWALANFAVATDPKAVYIVNGNLSANYDMNDFFDSFTIHWACRSMTTATRFYKESQAGDQDPILKAINSAQTQVPYGAIRFRHELVYQPDDFLRDKYPNLVHSITLDFGGHFAGFQEPVVLADSIWTCVEKMELFHSSQRNKSGK